MGQYHSFYTGIHQISQLLIVFEIEHICDLHMIGWIYSVVGFWTVVTAGGQKILEGAKTIVDTSNRSRVVTDVMYDGFMLCEKSLDVVRHPHASRHLLTSFGRSSSSET